MELENKTKQKISWKFNSLSDPKNKRLTIWSFIAQNFFQVWSKTDVYLQKNVICRYFIIGGNWSFQSNGCIWLSVETIYFIYFLLKVHFEWKNNGFVVTYYFVNKTKSALDGKCA